MRIIEKFSHLNGLEYILVHHPNIWEEIVNIIDKVDAQSCKTKKSKEKKKIGELLYSPTDFNTAFKDLLEQCDWKESRTTYYVTENVDLARESLNMTASEQKNLIEINGFKAIKSYNQTDFVKNKIAIEIQFGKYPFVAYDLFVKHMAFFVANQINVGIEILPMKELQSQMSSGIAYYEGEIYNVIRQGRSTPAVPLVIIGIAP